MGLTDGERDIIREQEGDARDIAHRRCELCGSYPDDAHCWINKLSEELDSDGLPVATHACRHCPAIGVECGKCDGTGFAAPDQDPDDESCCKACDGYGVIETAAQSPDGAALRCSFCGETSTHDDAIKAGWTPDFWLQTEIVSGRESPYDNRPACESCAAEHLDDLDDDPIIKPGHETYLTD